MNAVYHTRPTAEALNAHLRNGGVIQITTYARSTIYRAEHAGWFIDSGDGCLYVRQGKGRICLSLRNRMMVGLRMGTMVRSNDLASQANA